MKLPAIVRKITVLCLLVASNAASAAVVTASPSNVGERPLPNKLNTNAPGAPSACPSDAACPLQAGLPVAPAPGQTIDLGAASSSLNGMDPATSPFAGGLGEPAPAPAGSQAGSEPAVANYAIEAADKYASAEDLKWNVKLKLLQTFENVRSLLSLGEKAPDKAPNAGNTVSGQPQDAGAAAPGAGYAAGGADTGLGSLCVARDGSYNTVGAASQRSCPEGSVYVSTTRSAAMAEYAAFSQSLSYTAKGAAANSAQPATTHSRHDAAPVQYKHCSDCGVEQAGVLDPGMLRRILIWLKDPVSMLLLGLGVVAILVTDAVIKARRHL